MKSHLALSPVPLRCIAYAINTPGGGGISVHSLLTVQMEEYKAIQDLQMTKSTSLAQCFSKKSRVKFVNVSGESHSL